MTQNSVVPVYEDSSVALNILTSDGLVTLGKFEDVTLTGEQKLIFFYDMMIQSAGDKKILKNIFNIIESLKKPLTPEILAKHASEYSKRRTSDAGLIINGRDEDQGLVTLVIDYSKRLADRIEDITGKTYVMGSGERHSKKLIKEFIDVKFTDNAEAFLYSVALAKAGSFDRYVDMNVQNCFFFKNYNMPLFSPVTKLQDQQLRDYVSFVLREDYFSFDFSEKYTFEKGMAIKNFTGGFVNDLFLVLDDLERFDNDIIKIRKAQKKANNPRTRHEYAMAVVNSRVTYNLVEEALTKYLLGGEENIMHARDILYTNSQTAFSMAVREFSTFI